MDYNCIFKYVKEYLQLNEMNTRSAEIYPFRKRADHIKRVFVWANRLIDNTSNVNKEAILVAALFHDIGYGYSSDDSKHAENSAILCQRYLQEKSYNNEFIELVVYLVRNHSNKKLLKGKDTLRELIILIEADLLDETGALSIVWDSMTEGSQAVQSFEKTYEHILKYSFNTINQNPMVTQQGIEFWDEKKKMVNSFINHLELDLCFDVDELQEAEQQIV